jgi:hypothetical protein
MEKVINIKKTAATIHRITHNPGLYMAAKRLPPVTCPRWHFVALYGQ